MGDINIMYFLRSEIYEPVYSIRARKCRHYRYCSSGSLGVINSLPLAMFIEEERGDMYTINPDLVNSCPPSVYFKASKWEI